MSVTAIIEFITDTQASRVRRSPCLAATVVLQSAAPRPAPDNAIKKKNGDGSALVIGAVVVVVGLAVAITAIVNKLSTRRRSKARQTTMATARNFAMVDLPVGLVVQGTIGNDRGAPAVPMTRRVTLRDVSSSPYSPPELEGPRHNATTPRRVDSGLRAASVPPALTEIFTHAPPVDPDAMHVTL